MADEFGDQFCPGPLFDIDFDDFLKAADVPVNASPAGWSNPWKNGHALPTPPQQTGFALSRAGQSFPLRLNESGPELSTAWERLPNGHVHADTNMAYHVNIAPTYQFDQTPMQFWTDYNDQVLSSTFVGALGWTPEASQPPPFSYEQSYHETPMTKEIAMQQSYIDFSETMATSYVQPLVDVSFSGVEPMPIMESSPLPTRSAKSANARKRKQETQIPGCSQMEFGPIRPPSDVGTASGTVTKRQRSVVHACLKCFWAKRRCSRTEQTDRFAVCTACMHVMSKDHEHLECVSSSPSEVDPLSWLKATGRGFGREMLEDPYFEDLKLWPGGPRKFLEQTWPKFLGGMRNRFQQTGELNYLSRLPFMDEYIDAIVETGMSRPDQYHLWALIASGTFEKVQALIPLLDQCLSRREYHSIRGDPRNRRSACLCLLTVLSMLRLCWMCVESLRTWLVDAADIMGQASRRLENVVVLISSYVEDLLKGGFQATAPTEADLASLAESSTDLFFFKYGFTTRRIANISPNKESKSVTETTGERIESLWGSFFEAPSNTLGTVGANRPRTWWKLFANSVDILRDVYEFGGMRSALIWAQSDDTLAEATEPMSSPRMRQASLSARTSPRAAIAA